MPKISQWIAACAVLTSASAVFAHTQEHTSSLHSSHHLPQATATTQQAWGTAGQAKAVTRTITLRMSDDMRFSPNHIAIKLGETVRIQVENAGHIMHEIVLGTTESLDAHAAAMLQHPNMNHGDAFMAHVPPQKNGELIWTFNRPGNFDFACLIAGHFQAGMRGTITVTP